MSRQHKTDDTSCIRVTAEKHSVWRQAVDDSCCLVLGGSYNMVSWAKATVKPQNHRPELAALLLLRAHTHTHISQSSGAS